MEEVWLTIKFSSTLHTSSIEFGYRHLSWGRHTKADIGNVSDIKLKHERSYSTARPPFPAYPMVLT